MKSARRPSPMRTGSVIPAPSRSPRQPASSTSAHQRAALCTCRRLPCASAHRAGADPRTRPYSGDALEFLLVVARQPELLAIVQQQQRVSTEPRFDAAHTIDVHDEAPMDADEAARIELTGGRGQGPADEVTLLSH